ncbi:MAG TPA: DNA polymerase IV [Burkholderiaceae bacterium]|nr:DNA polymerase IV [Burkholderiaceae bacterium]
MDPTPARPATGEPVEAPDWETSSSARRIAHLDMDAFYASVELLRRPDLRGLPVAIGGRGDPSSRGVVTTATYEARAFGVRSGMALAVAARLCPDIVFLPTDFDLYRDYSRRFKLAIAEVTPAIEDRGIDEVYLDLTGLPGTARDIAGALQRRVAEATALSCSIGVAPNKLVAKICSDLEKPRGITVVGPGDVEARLWPLPAAKVPGIGPKAAAKLASFGVTTIGELAARDAGWLRESFGERYGAWLHRAARGLDDRPLDLDPEPRSRSRETTFERDLHPVRDWQALARTLAALSRQVAEDLRRKGYRGRTIGIKLRFADFRTVTRDRTIEAPIDDEATIRRVAFECLGRVEMRRPVRLVGVRVGELSPARPAEDGGSSPATEAGGPAAMPAPPRGAARDARRRDAWTLPLFDEPLADGTDAGPALG